MIGRTISHDHIVSQPGGGGIGAAHEAEDLKLDRHVALKFLPGEMENDPDARERFQREAFVASASRGESGTSSSASEMPSWNGDLGVSIETKVWVR
jgi:serine/threonine protein kinase